MNATVSESKAQTELRRAPRYSIVAPVRFRIGWGRWREGTTVNVGRLGLLLRTSDPPSLSTRLEMQIDLTHNRTIAGALVICWGRVVRSCRSEDGAEGLVAVTIDEFQMMAAVDDNASGASGAGPDCRPGGETR